jgi:hypothetical protein
VTHDVSARVDDECVRRQQRFDLLEQVVASRHRDQARAGALKTRNAACSTSAVSAGIRVLYTTRSPLERGARGFRSQAPHRDPATTSSCAVLSAGGSGGVGSASQRSASSIRPDEEESAGSRDTAHVRH